MYEVVGDCWIWTGRTHKGYARAGDGQASRWMYQRMVGPIPEGLELDHLCETPLCVNPEHLEPVTRLENMRRRYANYTHCKHGHEFTPANTYIRPSGHRDCRACICVRTRRYKARRAA
jgi:hypothetical protein